MNRKSALICACAAVFALVVGLSMPAGGPTKFTAIWIAKVLALVASIIIFCIYWVKLLKDK
jgi:hypothetical protein